jgi:hypothetical protein
LKAWKHRSRWDVTRLKGELPNQEIDGNSEQKWGPELPNGTDFA